MRVQVLQEDLSKAISVCTRFASTRIQLPVLANILFETTKGKLRISATNLEVSVSVSIGAKVETEGSITVPAKVISEIVSNLKTGQINLNSEKEILEIKSSEFDSKITGMNSSDFPQVPTEIGPGSVKVETGKFQEALDKILFSVSSDETRPVLTGVLIILRNGEIVLVSTDGFRLSQSKLKVVLSLEEEKRFIVPKTILSELARIQGEKELEFLFKKSENQVIFSCGNIVMASRIIDGEFPDFEKIIPKESKIKVSTDRGEFLRSVKLASVFARDSANVIKLAISGSGVEITAESQQHGSQKGKFDVKAEGLKDSFMIAFNYRFIEDFLNSVNNDDVEIDFSESSSPALFVDPKDTNFFHIIMPVRLQD